MAYELENVGFLDGAALVARVVSGLSDGLSLVRQEGQKWLPVGEIPGLRAMISAALSAADDAEEADDAREETTAEATEPSIFFYADAS